MQHYEQNYLNFEKKIKFLGLKNFLDPQIPPPPSYPAPCVSHLWYFCFLIHNCCVANLNPSSPMSLLLLFPLHGMSFVVAPDKICLYYQGLGQVF